MTYKLIKNCNETSSFVNKCLKTIKPNTITVFRTLSQSANDELKHMLSSTNNQSYHYLIDDEKVINAIPENKNAYIASDNGSYIDSISILICCNKTSNKYIQAEQNAAHMISNLLIEHGWGINRVKNIYDWNNCDMPTLIKDQWNNFIESIERYMIKSDNRSHKSNITKFNKKINKYNAIKNEIAERASSQNGLDTNSISR